MSFSANDVVLPPLPGGAEESGGTPLVQTNPPNIPTSQKFANQVFELVDTNDAAANDTNLYNACAAIPAPAGGAVLQIARYGTNAIVLRASGFDYSSEAERDFALVVCDNLQTPLWKSVNLLSSTNGQGWLIQGLIDKSEVTDPMFMLVTNLASSYGAFFRAIPYGGPQVQLTGPNPDDAVSNKLTLYASVVDLSGVTNQQYSLDVDGNTARYSVGPSNTIILYTYYTPNGIGTINLTVESDNALLVPPNPPSDVKLNYSGIGSLPVDFENATYVYSSGNVSSPDIGTNFTIFGVTAPQYIAATIYEPVSGRILKSFSGYDDSYDLVELDWNFTEADGVTPYTNNTYELAFTASASPISGSERAIPMDDSGTIYPIILTNSIDWYGVRQAAAGILNYESMNLDSYDFQTGLTIGYLDTLLTSVYLWYGTTQYTPGQVGPNRVRPPSPSMPFAVNAYTQDNWSGFLSNTLSSGAYSDFNYGPGHANSHMIGGGDSRNTNNNWVNTTFDSTDLHGWALNGTNGDSPRNWRLRKAEMWGCYTGDIWSAGGNGHMTWPASLGIRPTAQQANSFMRKNVGLFFYNSLLLGGYGSSPDIAAELELELDKFWVCGPNAWPGACDPTYSLGSALKVLKIWYPTLQNAGPLLIGYPYIPYAGIYDNQLLILDNSSTK